MKFQLSSESESRAVFNQLDALIQRGYKSLEARNVKDTCETWLEAWILVLKIAESEGFQTFEEFHKAFRGTHNVFNWIQDFEMEMSNLALDDAIWHQKRLEVCQQALDRFPRQSHLREMFRRGIAESWAAQGNRSRSDALYEEWLKECPDWAWGWIGWSDLYNLLANNSEKDLARAEALLKRGLSVINVNSREDILDRLASLYEVQGRDAEAQTIRKEEAKLRIPPSSLEKARPVVRAEKVGRNDPCPCGSSKKYKKCCGA